MIQLNIASFISLLAINGQALSIDLLDKAQGLAYVSEPVDFKPRIETISASPLSLLPNPQYSGLCPELQVYVGIHG